MFRILIIEDDANIRETLMEAGNTAGSTMIAVEHLEITRGRAVEKALSTSCDAIIVGGYFLEARVSDGPEIVRLIRRSNKGVIIVGTSGDSNRKTAFISAGATAFAVRGSQNNTTAGLLAALDLLNARDEKKGRPKKDPKPTPDQE